MTQLVQASAIAILVAACSYSSATLAAVQAGEVQQFRGLTFAASSAGKVRRLRRGGKIFSGDMLSTGPNSYLRIKYTDGGYMMLRPNSRFHIEKYEHSKDPAKAEEQSGFFRLLKGGLRAVTGLIGRVRKKNYRLATAVATIGIRGTDFSTRICAADCLDIDPPPADGLYVGLEHNTGVVIFNQRRTNRTSNCWVVRVHLWC